MKRRTTQGRPSPSYALGKSVTGRDELVSSVLRKFGLAVRHVSSWNEQPAMNRFLKVAVVVSCLLGCGVATLMLPTSAKMDDLRTRAIRVNNGHSVHALWLKV